MSSLVDQLTELYAFVDDFLITHPSLLCWRQSPHDTPRFADSEVLTLALLQGCLGVASLKQTYRLVAANFFWVPEDKDIADKQKSGIDNLAKALSLDGTDGFGWEALAAYAAETTVMADPQRKGVFCAPAEPVFDEKAADELANVTQTDAADWAFPIRDGIEVRAAAKQDAAVVDKLGLYLVRVLPDDSPANAVLATFAKVLTAGGKVGYVPIDTILPIGGEQLCYLKDGGAWKIAGFLGGEPNH